MGYGEDHFHDSRRRHRGAHDSLVQTAVDPSTFTEPAVKKGHFWLEAGAEIKPYDCRLAD
jgi:hypothetical protein